MMTRCVRAHAGAAWPAALPAIPYMRANLRWKAGRLAEADAIVAVSAVMARDLVARAPALAGRRVEVIPNPVDVATLDAAARPPAPRRSPTSPARTRSTSASSRQQGRRSTWCRPPSRRSCTWPLVVVGDGPIAPRSRRAARAAGLDVRFTGWLDRTATLAHVAHAALLVFPSHGPESLSRVLLEAGGARRAGRGDGHRRHARRHRAGRDRPAVDVAGGPRRGRRPARRRSGAARRASAPRRRPTSAPRSRRPPSSRASARSTTRSSPGGARRG